MATNLGRLHYEPFEVEPIYLFQTEAQIAAGEPPVLARPAMRYMRPWLGDKPWNEVCATLEQGNDIWFIAVEDNGFICCCERDPEMVTVTDIDIWQIDSNLPRAEIFCQHWTGEEVVPPEPQAMQAMQATLSLDDRLADVEARLAALEAGK